MYDMMTNCNDYYLIQGDDLMYEYASKGLRLYVYSSIGINLCIALICFNKFVFQSEVAILGLTMIQFRGLYIGGNDIIEYRNSSALRFIYLLTIAISYDTIAYPLISIFFICIGYIVVYYLYYTICVSTEHALIYMGDTLESLTPKIRFILLMLFFEMVVGILNTILNELGMPVLNVVYLIVLFASQFVYLMYLYKSIHILSRKYITTNEDN
jgi:hypothetical protein